MVYVFILFSLLVTSFSAPSSVCAQNFDSNSCGLLKDRIAGVFFGAAIGDALGRLTEFIPTVAEIHKKFGPQGIVEFDKRMELYHPFIGTAVVPYTDDTVMSLDLAKVMLDGRLHNASVDSMMDKLARSFARLLGKNRYVVDPLFAVRAHGIQNLKAALKLEHCIQYGNADRNPLWWYDEPSTTKYNKAVAQEGGCGSVMRAWPIGAIFADNSVLIKELADKQSMLTHRHPMARAASVALAVGVSQALLQKSPDEVAKAMIEAAQEYDNQELLYKVKAQKIGDDSYLEAGLVSSDRLLTSDMLRYAFIKAQEGKMPEEILGVVNDKQSNFRSKSGVLLGWSADEAVAAALYIFIRHPDDLKSALLEGANTPGDSDSIASLAGALVGARTGIQFLHFSDFDYSALESHSSIKNLANAVHDTLAIHLLKKGICA